MACRWPRSWQEEEDGASAVEFALVFPVLILLCYSLFEGGRMLHMQARLNAATSEASRILYVHPDAGNEDMRELLLVSLRRYDPGRLEISVTENTTSGRLYKVMSVTYHHTLAVPVGGLTHVRLKSVRYTPVIVL